MTLFPFRRRPKPDLSPEQRRIAEQWAEGCADLELFTPERTDKQKELDYERT